MFGMPRSALAALKATPECHLRMPVANQETKMTEPNLFQEIQADLDRQKWQQRWQRHGVLVISCALAIVVGTAAMSAWHARTSDRQQRVTAGLISVINQAGDDKIKAQALEDFAHKNHATVQAVFAELQAAAMAAKDGQTDEAVALYDEVAHDPKADDTFRQFGELMSVKVQMDHGDPAKLAERLTPLIADNAPWRFTALEYQGYLFLRAGNPTKARQIFLNLSRDATAPQTLSARAGDMLHSLAE
jgi:hypothetical protein